jgi:hypothetical protein
MVGHVACMVEMRNAHKNLVGRPRRRWENIKMQVINRWGSVDWMRLAQDRDQ